MKYCLVKWKLCVDFLYDLCLVPDDRRLQKNFSSESVTLTGLD